MSDSRLEMVAERWRGLWDDALKDAEWVTERQGSLAGRPAAIQGHMQLLDSLLSGATDVEAFRATFDKKNKNEWDFLGLKGVSGAMFLNKLVKHVPDKVGLVKAFRSALPAPADATEGRAKLQTFLEYLDEMIRQGQTTKKKIMPGYGPFFVTAWWHMRDTETWPMYFVSARKALQAEGLYEPVTDLADDYFRFRDAYLSLREVLGLSTWDLESLCVWHQKSPPPTPDPPTSGDPPQGTDIERVPRTSHTHIQWVLARLGRKLGCKVWIAANDHKKECEGQCLGDLSLPSLPNLGLDAESQDIIRLIDVLWIKGTKQVAAAFEVECTTSVYSGLLRLADLTALSPNLSFPLYIVVPRARFDKVRKELSRPTFQALELHSRCGFFSEEDLLKNAEGIMKWSTDPSAIDKLATKVGDAE